MVVEVNSVKDATMQLPPTTKSAVAATTSTYTTIPISGADVISRSVQNLSNFISRRRPWPEFIASGVFDRPDSISGAGTRFRKNSNYFGVNYGIVISTCAAVFLIGNPIALIIFALVFALWLILYFFREDPMIVLGHHVSDRIVMVGLVVGSLVAVWFTGTVNILLVGIGSGLLIAVLHGVFRNPEGLFLDEDDAVSNGLIRSRPGTDSHRVDFSDQY
ncbi:PRA1 family protein G2-like [Cornus florida]|uniref:PRA1 family protein G2-like n=1 Tax=Cornus florida TaxID=4283 RepID=UPI00289F0C74|nr:PRA1 family protein G2-like [Cornus florida]